MGHASRKKKERKRRNDGSAFERFIERIERVLAPIGATVTRNAKVPDVDTGKPRDIDVWIRYEADGREKRIMIECRDRSKSDDVMWIEQLIGKRLSIKPDVVVAVTRKPISEPARLKAEKHEIQVRRLRDLDQGEVLGMVVTGIPGLTMSITDVRMSADCDHGAPTTLTLTFADDDAAKAEEGPPDIANLLKKDVMRSRFLFNESGQGLTIGHILRWARMNGWDPTRGGRLGQDVESTVKLTLGRELFIPTTGGGRRRVVAVEIGYKAYRRLDPIETSRHAYEGTPSPTRVIAGQWTAPDRRNQYQITLAIDEGGLKGEVEAVPIRA